MNELFKKKYGIDMSENAARSFTAPFVLADAINRAKTTEAEAVVKALLSTNIPGDQVIYPWKGIQFDPQSHQNIHARGILVQIQNQNYVTVWPFESAAAPVIWPFPAWKQEVTRPGGGRRLRPPPGLTPERSDDVRATDIRNS